MVFVSWKLMSDSHGEKNQTSTVTLNGVFARQQVPKVRLACQRRQRYCLRFFLAFVTIFYCIRVEWNGLPKSMINIVFKLL